MHDEEQDHPPSKSQRKRDHRELQELAEELLALPEPRFRRLPLGERAREELQRGRDMDRGGSRNRQVRLIAQILVDEDLTALRAPPQELAQRNREEAARHHAAERLRERLLAEGAVALEGTAAGEADRKRAQDLVREARSPAGGVRARTAQRELYRFALALLGRGPGA